ncbi:MAG: glutathione peroxidase, partial [Methyloceanibacter sp.]
MIKTLALLIVAVFGISGSVHAATGFGFSFKGVDGEPLALDQYRGKAILVVNTATACGFSYQFKHLEEVWRDRKNDGLVIVGVSSNDFGGQEPRTGKALLNHCKGKYGVSFPPTERTAVVG